MLQLPPLLLSPFLSSGFRLRFLHKANRLYTWFVGFAPAEKPEVAIASLVVNTPTWRIKGPELARNVLRAYFATKGIKGVSAP